MYKIFVLAREVDTSSQMYTVSFVPIFVCSISEYEKQMLGSTNKTILERHIF